MSIHRAFCAAALLCVVATAYGQASPTLAQRNDRIASADLGSSALSSRDGMLSPAERARLFHAPTRLAHKADAKKAAQDVKHAQKLHRARRPG